MHSMTISQNEVLKLAKEILTGQALAGDQSRPHLKRRGRVKRLLTPVLLVA